MSIVERALEKAQRTRAEDARQPSLPAASAGGPRLAVSGAGDPRHYVRKATTLDRDRMRAAGLLPPLEEERLAADQYRRIKRPLVARALIDGTPAPKTGHLIMVASAFPGEGKTFTALNLALSLATEKDVSALLIDADIAKPQLSRLFGLEDAVGLNEVLADESLEIEEVIQDTDIPGLAFLPAGRRLENSAELLASARMKEVMGRVGTNNPRRLVVLDSPPLLLTNESREIAAVAGQVVVVVRAGSTERQAVLAALEMIPEGRHVGLVLNQADASSVGDQYYGYGRYGSYPAEGEP